MSSRASVVCRDARHCPVSALRAGFYMANTLEGLLLDPDGKQLMCEAVYLQGVMLLLMDLQVRRRQRSAARARRRGATLPFPCARERRSRGL